MIASLKPSKPTEDFPLYAHNSGKWAKKISGQLKYFGRWDDPSGALIEYNRFAAIPPRQPAAEA